MRYRIVTSALGLEALEDAVNKLLKEGWEPLGGVSSWAGQLVQAMILRDR